MTREFDLLSGRQLKDLLEPTSNRQQDTLALLRGAALATRNIAVATAGDALTNGASPDTNTEEALAHIDNDTHHLAVFLLLQSLADSAQHDGEPQTIDVDISLVLVLVGPLAAVLVLRVFPLGANAGLEQVVVGLLGEIGDGRDIVLELSVGDLRTKVA